MVPKWAAVALLTSSLACSGSELVFLESPELGDAKTIVFGMPDRTQRQVSVYDANGGFRLIAEPGEAIYAFGSDRDLEEVGLTEGEIVAAGPQDDAFSLEEILGPFSPPHRAMFEASTLQATWQTETEVPPLLLDYPIPTVLPPCEAFPSVGAARVTTGSLVFLTPLDDTHALFGTNWAELFVIGRDGIQQVRSDALFPIGYAVRQGSTMWAIDVTGRVMQGAASIELGITDTTTITRSPFLAAGVAFAARDGRFITVDENGDVAYFDGTDWNALDPLTLQSNTKVKVAISPEEAFYWDRGATTIARVSLSGKVTHQEVNVPDGVMSIGFIEGMGLVLGTGRGSFFKEESGRWELLGGDFGWWALDFSQFSEGFLFLLASGTVGQLRQGRPDLCETQPVLGFVNDGRITSLAEDVIVAGTIDGNIEAHYLDFQ